MRPSLTEDFRDVSSLHRGANLHSTIARQFLRKDNKQCQLRTMKALLGIYQLGRVLPRNEVFANEELQGRKVRPILAMKRLLFVERREWRKDF